MNANIIQLGLDKVTGDTRWRNDELPLPDQSGSGYATPVVRGVQGTR